MTVPPAAVAAPLLQFDSVAFQTAAGRRLLDGASFSVARGEFAVLAGPSGAGKSTVLRMCAALTRPQAGRVLVGGTDVVQLKRGLIPTLRRQIGLVEQDPQWIDGFDVLDNIMLPLVLAGEPRRNCRERAHAALVRVGLSDRGHSRIDALSGGEQQRAALARAIVHRPALLLVDEPTAHLDDEAARGVCELLAQFSTGGATVLMATHGEAIALPTSVRRLRLADGRIA